MANTSKGCDCQRCVIGTGPECTYGGRCDCGAHVERGYTMCEGCDIARVMDEEGRAAAEAEAYRRDPANWYKEVK